MGEAAHIALVRAILDALAAEKTAVDRLTGREREETLAFDRVFGATLDRFGIGAGTGASRLSPPPTAEDAHALFTLFLTERPGRRIPDTASPFAAPESLAAALEAALSLGLLARGADAAYRWTPSARAILAGAGRLDAEGRSLQDRRAEATAAFEAGLRARGHESLADCPDAARAHILRVVAEQGPMKGLLALTQVHDGTGWRPAPDPSVPPPMGLHAGKMIFDALTGRGGAR